MKSATICLLALLGASTIYAYEPPFLEARVAGLVVTEIVITTDTVTAEQIRPTRPQGSTNMVLGPAPTEAGNNNKKKNKNVKAVGLLGHVSRVVGLGPARITPAAAAVVVRKEERQVGGGGSHAARSRRQQSPAERMLQGSKRYTAQVPR